MSVLPNDMLYDAFKRQTEYMEMLRKADKMPEYPIDLTTKPGQRLIKETIYNMTEELFEASYTLKNKAHRLTDDRTVDFAHYKEELGDAFAYFMEACILSGITPDDLYEQFCKKNNVCKERLAKGY